MNRQIDAARPSSRNNVRRGFATISRLEDAALRMLVVQAGQARSYVHDVAIRSGSTRSRAIACDSRKSAR